MQTVILGTIEQAIVELFSDTLAFRIVRFPQEAALADVLGESQPLYVFDQELYDAAPAELKAHMQQHIVILLIEQNLAPDVTGAYRKAGYYLFYHQPELPIFLENLFTLVRTLSDQLTMRHRLDSYIHDSFKDIIDQTLLQKQKEEIEILNSKLTEMSRVDFLTNLLNRRALLEAFDLEKRRALRHRWRLHQAHLGESEEKPEGGINAHFEHDALGAIEEHMGNFACIIIDIDHFKLVNDTYGHLVGDSVLRFLGELLNQKGLFRDVDVKSRYGGEEFIALLPETNCRNALIPANRLAEAMRETIFDGGEGRTFGVTLSMGIAEFLPEELSSDEMIRRADQALYYAKEHGRNQIHIYEELQSLGLK